MSQKPSAFIVHGWGGTGEGIWIPEAREVLEPGFTTYAPDMPETDNPIYGNWEQHFNDVCPRPGAGDIGIGHSLGAGFWFRYLRRPDGSSLRSQARMLSHLILVAPTPDDCGIPEIANFFDPPVDHAAVKASCERITIFATNNDEYIPEIKARILAEKLEAEFILIPGAQHLSDSPAARAIGWPVLTEYLKGLGGGRGNRTP